MKKDASHQVSVTGAGHHGDARPRAQDLLVATPNVHASLLGQESVDDGERVTATDPPNRRMMPGNFVRATFNRTRLSHPADYYAQEEVKLLGHGNWRTALCPFHEDRNPSLRVFFESGAFRCMACGAHGGDIVAFHMLRHGLTFIEAAMSLGAWEVSS